MTYLIDGKLLGSSSIKNYRLRGIQLLAFAPTAYKAMLFAFAN
ncbi:TPA: hypothetical protein ACU23J_002148 [Staphylococcus aureus]